MKSKEYENEILNLQHELAEYDQVESRIQKHLDSVTQWASIEQSKRNSLRKRMEQTILNLEQQKVIARKKAKIKNEEKGFNFDSCPHSTYAKICLRNMSTLWLIYFCALFEPIKVLYDQLTHLKERFIIFNAKKKRIFSHIIWASYDMNTYLDPYRRIGASSRTCAN